MKGITVFFARAAMFAVVFSAAGVAVSGQVNRTDQTPAQLCVCNSDESKNKGGLATFEAFQKRYARAFKSPSEEQLGWQVYQAANRCNATMVIGRLEDTGGFLGKPGYCVLSDLKDWTISINDVFIHAGTDRQARFMLVSPVPMETMAGSTQQIRERGQSFPVVYNREIREIQNTKRYRQIGDADEYSRAKPGRFEPADCYDISGAWTGDLIVTDIRGASNIQPGQSRNANIVLEQVGCRVKMRFGGNETAGYLVPGAGPPFISSRLDEVLTGTVVLAEFTVPPSGPLQLTIEQRSAAASITSSGRLNRGR